MNKERTTEDIIAQHQQYVMPTYAPSLTLVKGEGAYVWDVEGNRYLDFCSGIAVTNIGHCHPRLVRAIQEQAATLMHVSNLYYNEEQPKLAAALVEAAGLSGAKCFFCNSGAEANEGMIKLARLWGSASGRHEIITMKQSFHGRTLATLTATGQDKVKGGFAPLPNGFVYADYNDFSSVEALVQEQTVAIMVESIQGEGGVIPATSDFLQQLRNLCDEKNLLLLCDEVQAGVGRTGTWFGFQHSGIEPDAFSLAKGLGGGFPIGALVAGKRVADTFQPGHHATTFGGTPLAAAAALAVMDTIKEEDLLAQATERGNQFLSGLAKIAEKHADWMCGARGVGLMCGLVLKESAAPLQAKLMEKGLLSIATAGHVLRMLPPMVVTPEQIDEALDWIAQAADELESEAGKK